MEKIIYNAGQKINGLTFIKELQTKVYPNGKTKRKAIIECKCGEQFETWLYSVIQGKINMCKKCRHKKVGIDNFKHGLINHKLYSIWADIKKRCYNKNSNSYSYYGAKGITMQPEWIDNPKLFIEYVSSLPNYDELNLSTKKLTIDRIDGYKGYIKGNLRLVGRTLQNYNKPVQKNNKTGYKGISLRISGSYQVQVRYKKKNYYLGTVKTINEAIERRNQFLKRIGFLNEYTKYEQWN